MAMPGDFTPEQIAKARAKLAKENEARKRKLAAKQSGASNETILDRIAEVFGLKASQAAKKAAKKGKVEPRLARDKKGRHVMEFVAVRSGEIGNLAYKKTSKADQESGLYRFQHTTVDVTRLPVSVKQVKRPGKKASDARTLDATEGLFMGGTVEQIKAYFSKNQDAYATFYSAANKSLGPEYGAHSKAWSGQDEPEYGDNPDWFEGIATLEPTPVHVYLSGLAILGVDDQLYTSKGSWGDVIATVAKNLIEFTAGAVGGAGGSGQQPSVGEEVVDALGEGAGIAKDIKDQVDFYRELNDKKYFTGKSPRWDRKFVEDYLKFEVCVSQHSALDGNKGVLAQDDKLRSELIMLDDRHALAVPLSRVGPVVDRLIEQAMKKLERDARAG